MKSDFYLRKFDHQKDLNEIFDIMIKSKDQMLFHGRIQFNSIADFEKWFSSNLTHHYHDFYVIEEKTTKETVGYIYSYEYRQYDGHCKVCTVLKEKYRAVGVGAIVGLPFLDELFSNYPLRKVYLDIYDYNKQSLQSNLDAGFVEEGCMKNFRYENGEYHDMHILALTRETFYKNFKGILNSVK